MYNVAKRAMKIVSQFGNKEEHQEEDQQILITATVTLISTKVGILKMMPFFIKD